MPKTGSLVFDTLGEYGVTFASGWWPFFGFRKPTVDEIWQHRIDNQEPGRREVHDPNLSDRSDNDE